MRMIRVRWFCWLAIACSSVFAQGDKRHENDPIAVTMEPVQYPPRTGTFYPVICKVTNRTQGIWEGSLRIRQVEDLPSDFEFVIPDLVVGGTPLEFLVTLPPIVPNFTNQQTELRADAVDKDGRGTELPRLQLLSQLGRVRTMVFALCLPEGASGIPGDLEPLTLGLKLFENGTIDTAEGRTVRTAIPRVSSRELPENPLDFTRFDGLLLSKLAIEQLRPKQMEGVETWVKGGGTLGVMVPEQGASTQVEFLNRLGAGSGVTWDLDGEKKVVGVPAVTGSVVNRLGFGQVVFVTEGILAERSGDPAKMEELARQLWRVTPNYEEVIKSIPSSSVDALQQIEIIGQQNQVAMGRAQATQLYQATQHQRAWGIEQVQSSLLLPKKMGVIPIQFLILSLVAYVILIGPGDYYILGWLRARRFTWVVFPLLTLGFSWGMLRVTNYVMGSNEQIHSVRVVDVQGDGGVLRENELSLLMFSAPKREQVEVSNGYMVRLGGLPSGFNGPGWDSRRWARQRPTYVGRIPGRYLVNIDAEQWTPEKYRTLKLGGGKVGEKFPWNKYARGGFYGGSKDARELREAFKGDVGQAFGRGAIAVVWDGIGQPEWLISPEVEDQKEHVLQHTSLVSLMSFRGGADALWVRRVSPQGGESYDDLALLEEGESREAVGIMVPEGENWVVYRLLCEGKSPEE